MIILQPYLYEIIRKYVDERIQSKTVPFVATENQIFDQIRQDIMTTLTEMEADGLICHYKNINHIKMYRPIDNEIDNV